jgi:hypothetical protein
VEERVERVVGVERDGAPGGEVQLDVFALDSLREGGEVLHADLEVDADLGERELQHLRDRLQVGVLEHVEAQTEPLGPGLCEQRTARLGVVRVGLVEVRRMRTVPGMGATAGVASPRKNSSVMSVLSIACAMA